jgi:hypothetical protein
MDQVILLAERSFFGAAALHFSSIIAVLGRFGRMNQAPCRDWTMAAPASDLGGKPTIIITSSRTQQQSTTGPA